MRCLGGIGWHLFVGCLFLFGGLGDSWANVAPIARNDSVRVEQNGKINIPVLANDSDADGDSLFSRGVLTDAQHSQLLVLNTDGTIHYRPQLEFVGQDSFVYLIDDGLGGLAGATVYVTVFPFYRAIDDTVYIKLGKSKSFSVLHNDQYDRVADSIYVTSVTPGAHTERVVVNTNQTLFYVPKSDFLGVDTLAYASQTTSGRVFHARVFVHNVLPSFAVNDTFSIRTGGRLNLWPLTNDWVVPGDTLQLVSFGEAAHAERLLTNSDGTIHYRPQAGFLGFDSFPYRVSDQLGNKSEATVVVEVLPLNKAKNDTVTLREGDRINVDVLANDLFFGNAIKRVVGFSLGKQSERVVLNSDGTLHYRPVIGFTGRDQFSYEIESGNENVRDTALVVVDIRSIRDIFFLSPDSALVFANQSAVIDVLKNDRHADHSPLRVVDVEVSGEALILDNNLIYFRPTASFVQVQMTYTVEDTFGGRATETVLIVQRPENAIGFAAADSVVVAVNGMIDVDVLANDEGGLVLVDVDKAAHGQVSIEKNRIRYIPQEAYEGRDGFVYIVADEEGNRVAARVFVTVVSDTGVVNPPDPVGILGDFDGDGVVGFADFILFATRFGLGAAEANFDGHMDFDGDGRIAFTDFLRFIGLFGKTTTGG